MINLAEEKVKIVENSIRANLEQLINTEFGIILQEDIIKQAIITPQNAQQIENAKASLERLKKDKEGIEKRISQLMDQAAKYEKEIKQAN